MFPFYRDSFCNINKRETFYYEDNLVALNINKLDNTLGASIAYNRKLNHMTQYDLANKLNLSVSTIRRYESNKIVPSKAKMKALNDLFNNFYHIKYEPKDSSFGSYLKYLRLSKNLTLSETCKITGLSISAICSYESNSKKPSNRSIERLRKLFDCL